MELARRGFLKALSALPAAPIAAKNALAQTGISAAGFGSAVGGIGAGFGTTQSLSGGEDLEFKGATWLLRNGVPAFVKEAIRRDYRVPTGLDPDLAANRSFSLVTKVRLQRERDIERRFAEVADRQRTTLARKTLSKTLGFDFWW